MTDNDHPITPPEELVQQWAHEHFVSSGWTDAAGDVSGVRQGIATQAARWGADQELEACCEHLKRSMSPRATVDYLRAARRPKPPSLKEQALEEVGAFEGMGTCNIDIIRRALEQLDD